MSIRMNAAPAERLRAWMEWLGVSQAKMGERLGCHQSVVSNILAGKATPNLEVAAAIEAKSATWPNGPIHMIEWVDVSVRQSA